MTRPELRYLGPLLGPDGQTPVPAEPPLTLATVRDVLGFSSAYPDAELTTLVWQAVDQAETETGLRIRQGRYEASWMGFPWRDRPLEVPGLGPAVESVTYYPQGDRLTLLGMTAGSWVTTLHGRATYACIRPAASEWPRQDATYGRAPRVFAQYTAGTGAAECPPGLQAGMLACIRWLQDESEAGHMQMRSTLRGWAWR